MDKARPSGATMHVVRWGRSAYERDADRAVEQSDAARLGHSWEAVDDAAPPPSLRRTDVLVVTSGVRVTDDVLAALKGHLVIATTSGFDHIDCVAASRRGITVARCPMARRDAVVEHTLAGVLGLLRRFPTQVEGARAGRWERENLPRLAPRSLAGARALVVGQGVIGLKMAEVLHTLGANVRAYDPNVRSPFPGEDLDDELAQADIVTLHASLDASSRGLLHAERLARLPAHAIVANTARGELLDVEAAAEAVQSGRLGGLLVDVFPIEPYPRLAALSSDRVWCTPHAAGFSDDLGERVAREIRSCLTLWSQERRVPYAVSAGASGQ